MQLTVLGNAGTFPGASSPCSGYLVEHNGFRLVLDLGAGVLGNLQRHCGLLDIDAIYISHLHADHCIDLLAYSYALRYHPAGLPPVLPVYGPEGTRSRIAASYENPPVDGLMEVFDFIEAGGQVLQIGPFTVTVAVVNHPVECHGLRIEVGGKVLTYSADTGVSDVLVDLARGADLFLCEASWSDAVSNPPGIHLSGRQAGEHAQRAAAGRLLLTHLVAWSDTDVILDEATRSFGGSVEVARCGASYDV